MSAVYIEVHFILDLIIETNTMNTDQTAPLHKQKRVDDKSHDLTLNAPIATKVVCFSRLLKCLRSLDPDQTALIGCLLLYLIGQ